MELKRQEEIQNMSVSKNKIVGIIVTYEYFNQLILLNNLIIFKYYSLWTYFWENIVIM